MNTDNSDDEACEFHLKEEDPESQSIDNNYIQFCEKKQHYVTFLEK